MYGALCPIPLFAFVVWYLNTWVAVSFPLLYRVKLKQSKFPTCLRFTKWDRLTQSMNVEDNTTQSTNSRVQSRCWETSSGPARYAITLLLWKPDLLYCVRKSPLRPLSWARWIQFNTHTYSCRINLNIMLLPTTRSYSSRSLLFSDWNVRPSCISHFMSRRSLQER